MADEFDPVVWCLGLPDKWCRKMKKSECDSFKESGVATEPIPLDEADPDKKPFRCPDCIAYGIISVNIRTQYWEDPVVVPMLDITRSSMIGFRELLARSTFGRRMLSHYYDTELGEEIQSIAREHPEISREMAEVGLTAIGFAGSVLRSDGDSPIDEARIFPQELFDRLRELGDRVRSKSSNPRLLEVLDEVQVELKRFVGMTALEALTVLAGQEPEAACEVPRAATNDNEYPEQ